MRTHQAGPARTGRDADNGWEFVEPVLPEVVDTSARAAAGEGGITYPQ